MMSPWWLLVIVPVSVCMGLVLGGIFSISAAADRCAECMREKSE